MRNKMIIPGLKTVIMVIGLGLAMLACNKSDPDLNLEPVKPSVLPDLSGLSWVKDDLFIGVHDAKNNTEKENWPRISLIRLPQSELDGVIWETVDLNFPGPGGQSSDMESSCSIPGGTDFLFVESGQEGASYRRIFHAGFMDEKLKIVEYSDWPVDIFNVEATEVSQVGQQLVFLFAERAEDSTYTKIRWCNLSLNPMSFGEFSEVIFVPSDPTGPDTRPIVAMDIDSEGFIYIVSAYDSGNDNGPFRSVIWMIGRLTEDGQGNPTVELGVAARIANLDGLKVESLAIRELGSDKEIYFGTDDEHYGGILRLVP